MRHGSLGILNRDLTLRHMQQFLILYIYIYIFTIENKTKTKKDIHKASKHLRMRGTNLKTIKFNNI